MKIYDLAMDLFTRRGTVDHPYDQSSIGDAICGTPCCILGHACVRDGVADFESAWDMLTPMQNLVCRQVYEHVARSLVSALGPSLDDPEATLARADLHDADLHRANLMMADLHGANLRGADLRGANLMMADLRGANLRGVNLRGASLLYANLRGADLLYANLRGADLRRALTGVEE